MAKLQVRRALQSIVLAALLTLVLTSCARNEEQAIRHVVLAELIQREHLPESHIEVQSVRFVTGQRATVTAKVLGQGGRADTWRTVRCTLERDAGRWTVREISPS